MKLKLEENAAYLSVLGTYMPCTGTSLEEYRNCIADIEQQIAILSQDSAVIIAGDLNTHIGSLGSLRSDSPPNDRCILWKEILDAHTMYVASLGALAQGPVATYQSGERKTTLDYIIATQDCADPITSCQTQ